MALARVTEIDGLRAIAMTMVVAQHCSLLPFGWAGVWVFFVISGYVITLSLQSDAQTSNADRYKRFVLRRFFRIVPLYLLYIGVVSLVALALGQPKVLNNLSTLLTFTYNWQMIYNLVPADGFAPIGHLWTLSIEEQFYILFPLMFIFLGRRAFAMACIAMLIAGPFIRFGTSLWSQTLSSEPGWLAFSIYASAICHFDAFIAGALLATYQKQIVERPAI